MEKVKNYILSKVASKELLPQDAKLLLQELTEENKTIDNDIAIIGISGKFPNAEDVETFWENIKNGVNCVQEWPENRRQDFVHILKNPYYTELLFGESIPVDEVKEGMYVKGGYLKEIDKFDYEFFGIPNREAKYMDPRQRLILESAWEAIEDAGYGAGKIDNTHTGVFIGKENTNFTLYKFGTEPDPMHLTGGWVSIHASRLSYMYNLTGPCMIVDTACSSGLSSVHVAIKSILNGECDMAIAGAINTSLNGQFKNHKEIVDLSSVQSSDMLVRTFDKNANGTVWGEGVAMVILKPLKKAIEDRDNIHAIIKGSAMNNDGASNGITAPNSVAQEKVILEAWKNAGISGDTITYIEAHGTGTVLGDPIEIKGLTNAFKKHTDHKQFCAISSLKTNMGHLVACSGMASLVKVVMSLKNHKIAPTINFEAPNPYIDFMNSPLYINNRLTDWDVDGMPRRAGASSFGFSGTNLHMIFEEYVPESRKKNENKKPSYCLTISAKKLSLLKDFVDKYQKYFESGKGNYLEDLCYTANTGRGHFNFRLAVVADTLEDLKKKIQQISKSDLENLNIQGVYFGAFKVVKSNKTKLDKGELYESQKKDKTELAKYKLKDLQGNKENYTQLLKDIASLYVNSADIDWASLYKDEICYRTSIPTYPLERLRCWAEPKVSKVALAAPKTFNHLLIDTVLADSLNFKIYGSTFKAEPPYWMLTDHKISSFPVIPGTTYLEMAHQIGQKLFGTPKLEFKDIIFLTPMIVPDGVAKEVHIVFEPVNQNFKFYVASKTEDSWIKHVEGEIQTHASTASEFDINHVNKNCTRIREGEELKVTSDVFQFGPRWNTVRKACHGPNDVFITLELLDEIKSDVDQFYLHPSLLDNAVNILSQSFGEGTYLPLNYKSFKVFGPLPSKLYSYVKKKENSAKNLEIITFDIVLLDESYNVLGEITDYSIKRVHNTGSTFNNLSGKKVQAHKMNWVSTESLALKDRKKGTYLVLSTDKTQTEKFKNSLKSNGSKVISVNFDTTFSKVDVDNYNCRFNQEDFNSLFDEIKGEPIDEILFVNGDEQIETLSNPSNTEGHLNQGLYGLFHLVKSLLKTKTKVKNNISLLVANANMVSGNEKYTNPFAAAMIGFALVMKREYQNMPFKVIDTDLETSVETILNEITFGQNHYIALRQDKKYQQELVDIELNKSKDLTIKENGTYLITGGAGGLGLEIGKYIAKQAKVNLVLVNRSKFPEKENWNEYILQGENDKIKDKIRQFVEIEQNGSTVICLSADVSDYSQMQKLTQSISVQFGKINGIIHAAGVAGDGFVMNKDLETFKAVVNPKINGTIVLNALSQTLELDIFLLFSSIATMSGTPGQGDYTAANMFLNSFTANRNEAVAINWPGWTEVGMAADYKVTDDYTMVHSLKTEEALSYLKPILESSEKVVIPGALNLNFLSIAESNIDFVPAPRIKSKIEKLKKSTAPKTENTNESKTSSSVEIKGKSNDELTEVEKNLAIIWSKVLGASEIDVFDTFQEMGGDSILATHLLKAIEQTYPGAIDISDIFSYPTIEQMAEYISASINASKEPQEKSLDQMLDAVIDDEASIDSLIDALK